MSENKKFEVKDLLKTFQSRVPHIQFLQGESVEKGKIQEALKELSKIFNDGDENIKWAEVHEKGQNLWKNLASCALNSIDPNSKGNSKLFDYLVEATKFEDLLYGLEEFYRDHTIHSLWVYLIGDNLMNKDLNRLYKNLNWYLYNDIKNEEGMYGYRQELVEASKLKKKKICDEVNEHKDAIWCIIALCHDLGYSLAKLNKLNERVQKVLEYFDVSNFKDIGYSLDIEHQYLVSQFLELMAMDVRIEPGEGYDDEENYVELEKLKSGLEKSGKAKNKEYKEKEREYERKLEGLMSIKCYRDDSTYWRLCRAMESKEHGILSSYLIYKVLGIFAESSVRGTAEEWGLNDREAKGNIIRGDILFAIAQHEFNFAHLNQLGSLADILIIADELEEFSRLGRPLTSRNYDPTTAETSIVFKNCEEGGEVKPGENIDITMEYDSKHKKKEDFFGFMGRKARRLCSIYSLERSKDEESEEEREKENYCTINSIKMIFKWEKPNESGSGSGGSTLGPYSVLLSNDPEKTKANLPTKNGGEKTYKIKIYDDELYINTIKKTLKDYLKELSEAKSKKVGKKNRIKP